MQANFQLLTGDPDIGGGLLLPVTQSWAADNIVAHKACLAGAEAEAEAEARAEARA